MGCYVWTDRHGEVCRGILALLVAKMIKIEFLYGIVMDIHVKGARLLDPLEIFPLHISCCKVRFVLGRI